MTFCQPSASCCPKRESQGLPWNRKAQTRRPKLVRIEPVASQRALRRFWIAVEKSATTRYRSRDRHGDLWISLDIVWTNHQHLVE